MKELNEYLIEVVKNSNICEHCIFNHNGICFFSYECIKNNYDSYKENTENERAFRN